MLACFALIEDPKELTLFEQLYNTYKDSMHGVANRILRDNQLAEDTVAETFLKIAKNISKISEIPCNERGGYIVILTRNTAFDMYRKRRRKDVPVDFLEELTDRENSYTIDEKVFTRDSYRRLTQAIEQMEDKYRDILKLYYIYEYPAAEIAALFGIREETVRVRISRARKMLVTTLNRKGGIAR